MHHGTLGLHGAGRGCFKQNRMEAKELQTKEEIKKLDAALLKYESAISVLKQKIKGVVEFEFSIFYQSSDGFVLEYNTHNAPLDDCLGIIKAKGKLTFDDYDNLTI